MTEYLGPYLPSDIWELYRMRLSWQQMDDAIVELSLLWQKMEAEGGCPCDRECQRERD